jgi:hypothetical protein
MKEPNFQATLWIILSLLLLSGCAGKVVVKNCEHIANDVWECDKL